MHMVDCTSMAMEYRRLSCGELSNKTRESLPHSTTFVKRMAYVFIVALQEKQFQASVGVIPAI
jgi:hypothetical protein